MLFMIYDHRVLENKPRYYLRGFSVVGLTGPRESGKSTLLLKQCPDYTYVTFDDYHSLNAFQQDPEKFMRLHDHQVIFDEVQHVPEIFRYVKRAVDQDRDRKGKFILTGSNQFVLVRNISDSLAGRIGLLTLLPYQYQEMPNEQRERSIYRGAYPSRIMILRAIGFLPTSILILTTTLKR